MITYLVARGTSKSKLITAEQINKMHEKGYITQRQAIEMLEGLWESKWGSKKEEDINESDSTGTRDSDANQ